MKHRRLIVIAALVMAVLALAGCTSPPQEPSATVAPAATVSPTPAETLPLVPAAPAEPVPAGEPKYVFLFIGDGMSFAQVSAAQYFSGSDKSGDIRPGMLKFTQFPVTAIVDTYNETSAIPDSASSGTAIACGVRTKTGMLGLTADGKSAPSVAELAHAAGKKVGIISSVTLNNATLAAFYAHTGSRTDYAEIARQMADSGFEYFGGGGIYTKSEKDNISKDYKLFEKAGYAIADTRAEIEALGGGSGKVYAVNPSLAKLGALPFAIDAKEGDMTLADFVSAGIRVLDGDDGFFMMCEGGKIDWSCHANDAATTVREVLAFADAVQVAVDFANEHPDETLIVITADHETGGMSVGYAATAYETDLALLKHQKVSYSLFEDIAAGMLKENPELSLDGMMPVIGQYFGLYPKSAASKAKSKALVLSSREYGLIEDAFAATKGGSAGDERADLLYGGYDPLTVTLTRILAGKAGVGWTTYAHTGLPVPVYAMGAGAELMGGSYHNTEIFSRLVQAMGLEADSLRAAS
ncbi:MAG: alkaline phosphatase [Christensenellales bacterium]|jgi:alkaline phosphatase